jgi:hypothetical protein
VGVVILLKEEVEGVERILALHRQMEQPLDELGHVLETLLELPGAAKDARLRTLLDDAQRALARVRKGADEVHGVLTGAGRTGGDARAGASAARRFDPGALMHRVVGRALRSRDGEGTTLHVVTPPALPPLAGDEHRLEALLVRLVEARLAQEPAPQRLVLGARVVGAAGEQRLLISLAELGRASYEARFADAPVAREEAAALGAELHGVAHPRLGRATLLRLRV